MIGLEFGLKQAGKQELTKGDFPKIPHKGAMRRSLFEDCRQLDGGTLNEWLLSGELIWIEKGENGRVAVGPLPGGEPMSASGA